MQCVWPYAPPPPPLDIASLYDSSHINHGHPTGDAQARADGPAAHAQRAAPRRAFGMTHPFDTLLYYYCIVTVLLLYYYCIITVLLLHVHP
jgi:hypothetical protein